MAVHRSTPRPARDTTHVALGWVLVSIDDIESLIAFIREHEGPDAEIKMRFFGGRLDRPEDLRQLTDAELRHIEIESPNLKVGLGPRTAYVNGDPALAQDLYELWARPRQTWRLPSRRAAVLWTTVVVGITGFYAMLLLAGIALPVGVLLSDMRRTNATTGFMLAMPVLSVAMIVLLGRIHYRTGLSESHAVLVPLSADELRKSQLNQKFPRWSLIVAIIAVIVAVTGIFVGVIVNG